jgi:excisionase family DNA binding protein
MTTATISTHPPLLATMPEQSLVNSADSPLDHALLLTPEEAARRLSIGRTTIYALMASGDLPSVTIGRCRRIPASALKSFVVRLGDEASSDRRRRWHYGPASESTAR